MVQALQAAGKNLTRQGLMNAIAADGTKFVDAGFVPYSYSSTVHFGYEGEQLYKMSTSATPITLPSGTYMGVEPIGPVYYTARALVRSRCGAVPGQGSGELAEGRLRPKTSNHRETGWW